MAAKLEPIDAATAARLREAGALMVDVREDGEFASIRVPMSQNIPLSRLERSALPLGPGQAVVFYCASGNRTNVAASRLAAKAGTAKAYVLAGGISAWGRAGLPVERGQAARTEAGSGRSFFSRLLGL